MQRNTKAISHHSVNANRQRGSISLLRLLPLAFATLLFASCGLFKGASDHSAANATIQLSEASGWLGDSSSTTFSYSFELGKNEVTQGEWVELMGYNPNPGTAASNAVPVTMVSWFDAILYCNALSLKDHYDTVYSYTQILRDSLGQTLSIEGIQTNLGHSGYRLPTEAEWEYASRGSQGNRFPWGSDSTQASRYAWFEDNAEGTLHEACSREKTGNGFCDLAGNTLEWVNDWAGQIPKGQLSQYAGPAEPNGAQGRMVKGGSFQTGVSALAAVNRRDVYGTYSSTRTDYIGFRIARGAIPSPTYSQNGQTSLGEPVVTIAVTTQQVQNFFGTSHVRVVWTSPAGQLHWIDWSESPPQARPLSTPVPAYHPSISPDGVWVAWSTRSEGQTGTSRVYVQNLNNGGALSDSVVDISAAIPRWWIDPASKLTYLIYASSAMPNTDSTAWSREQTWRRLISSGKFQSPAEILSTQGSFHGGLSANGSFLFSSYTSLLALDVSKGTTQTLFLSPLNGKEPSGSSQACNASVAPSGPSRALFLDFGYPKQSSLTGSSYGVHEYLLMADSSGAVPWMMHVPSGRIGWDFTEWSNLDDYAIGASFASTETRDQVHAIRMHDKQSLNILEGVEFQHPGLWVLPLPSASTLNFDSLFEYDQPSTDYRAVFAAKMRLFWLRHEQINTILMGSSRMMNGLDPSFLTDCVPYNMAYSGADLHSTIRQLQEYIIPHTPLLKTIVFSLDIDLLARAPQWFDLRIATSPGYRYDQNHEFWHKGFPAGFYSYLEQLTPTTLQESLSNFGYLTRDGSGWGAPDILPLGEWSSTPNAWKASLDSLSTLLQNLSAQSIQVVGVIFPQNPAFSNGLYLYGPDRSQTTDQIMSYTQTLQEKFPHFHVIDFHQNGQHDFGPEDASSEDHLSPQGAIKLTQRLDPMLKQFAP